jgi:hypothetical protein
MTEHILLNTRRDEGSWRKKQAGDVLDRGHLLNQQSKYI